MTEQDIRLARLESELAALKPSWQQRLEQLEKHAATVPRRSLGARLLAWMGPALPQLLTSAVMLLVAFWVKDSVDLAIKRQQLEISYATGLKAQFEEMAKQNAPVEGVAAAAIVAATYGRPALLPMLVNDLSEGPGNRATGAETGLRLLAFTHPDDVCELVPRIMTNPAKPLDWNAQRVAARMLAIAACTDAVPVLRSQRDLIASVRDGRAVPSALTVILVEVPNVTQQKDWLSALDESLQALSRKR